MLQLMGQFLALVAMAASVVNGQCVVSCSLLSQPASFDEKAHACCPHESAPNPKQQSHDAPCPPPLPAASKDRAERSSTSSDSTIVLIEADFSHQYRRLAANTFPDPVPFLESPSLHRPSLISILRI